MKKIICISLIVCVITSKAQTPNWMWGQCGGGGSNCGGIGVTISNLGHVYTGARFAQTCTFGTVTATGPGANNVLHGRFDTAGVATCKWLSPDNFTSGEDYAYGFAMDNRENTYVTGTTNSGYNGWFVDKYDSSGNKKWAYNPTNTTGQSVQMPAGYAVAVDGSNDSNNVFVVGEYSSSITIGSTTLTSVGSDDIFLAKIDSSGNPIWAVSAGGTGLDGGRGIAIDPQGYIYICGSYNGAAAFGTHTTPPSNGTYPSLFVAKYDRSGNALWVNTATNAGFGTSSQFWLFETMNVDSCGNGYVTGTYVNTAQFGSTSISCLSGSIGNIYVAKILTNGNWEWAKSAGGTGGDGGLAVALDKYSDVYVTGGISSATAKFDSIAVTNTSAGGATVFVAKYANSTGDAQWVLTQDGSGGSEGQGLTVDDNLHVYMSGLMFGTCTFGTSTITSAGGSNVNVLLAKIDTVPMRAIIPDVNHSYCPGSTVSLPYTIIGTFNSGNVFTAQLSDSTGSFANAVNIGDTSLSTDGSINITIPIGTPAGTYLIRVVSSSPATSSWANGCGAYYNKGVYINDFYVTIGGNLIISVVPAIDTVCSGSSVQLKASGGTSYLWSNSDTTSIITVNPITNTTYYVTASNGACSGKDSVVMNVTPALPLNIEPQDLSLCNGSSVTLVVPVSGSNYIWSPATTLSSSTGDSVVATPDAITTYTVTGINSLGCTVTGYDTVSIKHGVNKPVITDTDNVLTTTATQGNQWYRNDIEIGGATGIKYTITDTGCYWDIATNIANGCSSISDTLCITSLAGINRLAINPSQLSIYPNPTGGEIFVNISSSVADVNDWNLQITDVLGRTVYTKWSLNYSNDIDLSNLPGSVYFITVISKTGRVVVPVVKQ